MPLQFSFSRWRRPRWLRGRRGVAFAVAGFVLLAATIAIFHPAVQTRLVREHLGPRVDRLEVARVHVLPWRAAISDLVLHQDGLRVAVRELEAGVSPWRLLFDVLGVRWLRAHGVSVDLSDVPPGEPAEAPFGGLFATLSRDVGLALGEVSARGTVRLDARRTLAFRVAGGGLAPEADGTLEIDLTARDETDDSRVELAGAVTVGQHAPGRFRAVDADLLLRALSPRLPREEWLEIDLAAKPLEVEQLDEDGEPAGWRVVGDRFRVALAKPGDAGDMAAVSLTGTLDAREARIAGDFAVEAGDELVVFYLEDAALPVFAQRGGGTWSLDLATLALALDYEGEVRLSALERVLGDNEALPSGLRLDHAFGLTASAETVELRAFAAHLRAPGHGTVLSLVIDTPVAAPTAAPRSALDEERTLGRLTLDALPLTWLNGLLPEPWLRGGALAGAFTVHAGEGGLELRADERLGADAELETALGVDEVVSLEADPAVAWRESRVALTLPRATLAAGETPLGELGLRAALDTAQDGPARPDLRVSGALDLNALAAHVGALDASLGDRALPDGLGLGFEAELSAGGERVRVRALSAALREGERATPISVDLVQAFAVILGEDGPRLDSPSGELAVLALRDLDLGWLDPWWAGGTLAGHLADGELVLEAGADGRFAVAARRPVVLRGVDVATPDGPLVKDLGLSVRPSADYGPDGLALRYESLETRVGGRRLAWGAGAVNVPAGAEGDDARTSAQGQLTLDLAALRLVPAIAGVVSELPAERAWRLDLDYAVSGDATQVNVSALDARLAVDGTTRLRLASDAPLVLRPDIAPGEPLARHLTGAVTAEITALDSALLGDLLPLGAFAFDELSALTVLRSDGAVLRADTQQPLVLAGARFGAGADAVLAPFTLTAAASLTAAGATVDASLEALALTFDAYPERPAFDGALSFRLEPGRAVALRRLEAALEGHLPPLLAQPVLMPGHQLRDGRFRLDVAVAEDGTIGADAVLDGLESGEALAIDHVEARADGALAPDGQGFRFDMPLTGAGRSGETDGRLVASYRPVAGEKSQLELAFTSGRFLLNDVLAALESIAPPSRAAAPAADAAPVEAGDDAGTAAPSVVADAAPFWDLLPYDTRLAYYIRDLYYTDYVIFNDVSGDVGLTSEQLALRALSARFHDSPLRFDGTLDFAAGTGKPYQLEIDGTIREFDLNQFFTELVPGSKPRVEGLFSVQVDGYGASPNMAQFRNELLFDMRLASREGLFRPLPPDSGLLAGASDVLGVVGETLSYLPTGGFGAGAVSRLVNYISVIDYDRIDIHLERDETRDIAVRRFLVQSPTVSLTASGGIDYVDGVDILASPLELDARLNMSGKGAAILYSLGLLHDEQDTWGYYLGPEFRIRGTPTNAESNFDEIVQAAADGAVKGGFTRPLSGLVGNVKHRWFGETPEPYRDDEPRDDGPGEAP